MEKKLILTGLGGQGVVFLTRLLANTAVSLNHPVIVSETHGMSRRGGSVMSHLKIGGSESPLIRRGTADIIIALETGEAIRNLSFLRPGGSAFINSDNGLPSKLADYLERSNIQTHILSASNMAVGLGNAAVTNAIMAGFAVANSALSLPIESIRKTMAVVAKRGLELNLQALEAGFQAGNQPRSTRRVE
ncbi:MAG: indolepyruvate oxidoreductase [Chloroflexi bacterium]|nr:indolepyruvate oxidoreductase [Chloroflexota bacterium]